MAAMNEMDRLMNTLRINLPGAVDSAIQLELFNAIDEHLRRTNAWRYETDIRLAQGHVRYPIFPPAGTALVRAIGVTQNGRPILSQNTGASALTQRGRITADVVDPDGDALFDADATVAEGAALRYALYFPTYITIDIPPSPDAIVHPIKMVLALTLAQDNLADDVGDWPLEPWMHERFFSAWLSGALFRMMSQISKPWTNAQMALFHGKRFRNFMSGDIQEAQRGHVYNPPSGGITRRGGWT